MASGDLFAVKDTISREVDQFARTLSTKRVQTDDDAEKSRIVDRQFAELAAVLVQLSRNEAEVSSDVLSYTIRRMAGSSAGLAALTRLIGSLANKTPIAEDAAPLKDKTPEDAAPVKKVEEEDDEEEGEVQSVEAEDAQLQYYEEEQWLDKEYEMKLKSLSGDGGVSLWAFRKDLIIEAVPLPLFEFRLYPEASKIGEFKKVIGVCREDANLFLCRAIANDNKDVTSVWIQKRTLIDMAFKQVKTVRELEAFGWPVQWVLRDMKAKRVLNLLHGYGNPNDSFSYCLRFMIEV